MFRPKSMMTLHSISADAVNRYGQPFKNRPVISKIAAFCCAPLSEIFGVEIKNAGLPGQLFRKLQRTAFCAWQSEVRCLITYV